MTFNVVKPIDDGGLLSLEVEGEIRGFYAPDAAFRKKAEDDLRAEVAILPESIFSRDLPSERIAELVALAVERARAAFLAGEDRGNTLAGIEDELGSERARQIHEEELPRIVAAFADPAARKAALPIFENVAEGFSALTLALVRIVRALEPREGEVDTFTRTPTPWHPASPQGNALTLFTSIPSLLLSTQDSPERMIRAPLTAARLSPAEITAAAGRIRTGLLELVRDFPFGRPFYSARWVPIPSGGRSLNLVGPPQKITDLAAYLAAAGEGSEGFFSLLAGKEGNQTFDSRILEAAISSGNLISGLFGHEIQNLVAQEAAAAGEARARSHIAIPSDYTIPILFTGGVPIRDQISFLRAIPNEDADGNLESVTFDLQRKDEDSAQLTLHGDGFPRDRIKKRNLSPIGWRSEALALLPKILGTDELALYYATWQGIDADGDFAFHPAPFLELFGMKDDSKARKRLEKNLRNLTLTELKITRKYGPSMGNVGVKDEARLIDESSFKRTLFFPGRPRLKLSSYRHAPPMLEIRRSYHVKVPKEAFRLVGRWHEGAGKKDDGWAAFSLVAASYVYARTYAGRSGKQSDETLALGPNGYEMPLERILLASGFTSPPMMKKDRGRVEDRAAEAIERIRDEFRFFGPGTSIQNGRFRFDSPEPLLRDLEGIATAKEAFPPPPPAIDVPPKARRKRAPRAGRKGGR